MDLSGLSGHRFALTLTGVGDVDVTGLQADEFDVKPGGVGSVSAADQTIRQSVK